MLGLKLMHVDKRGPKSMLNFLKHKQDSNQINSKHL